MVSLQYTIFIKQVYVGGAECALIELHMLWFSELA
jgi:hypothetical protein